MQAGKHYKQAGWKWQARPLVPVALAWLTGIAAGSLAGKNSIWLVSSMALAGVAGFAICFRLKKTILPAGLILCLAAGTLAIWLRYPESLPPRNVARFAGPTPWQVTGTVAEPVLESESRSRLVLEVESIRSRAAIKAAGGRLLVNILGPLEGRQILAGDRISVRGRIKLFHNFNNPGCFDYRRYMASRNIFSRTYCRPDKIIFLGPGPGYSFKRRLDAWRKHLVKVLEGTMAGFDPQVRAVSRALLLGDRSRVSSGLRRDFNRAGVGHVLAISGLHLGLVAAGSLALFTRLFAWCGFLRAAGRVRPAAALAAFIPTLAYALLAGMTPSTQRALIMVAVFLAALALGRRHDLANTLALAALVITVADPGALFAVSFQLSFAAVIGIVWLLERLSERLPAAKTKTARLANQALWLVLVNLAAFLATLPIVVRNFNQLSLVGGAANLAVVPLVALVVLPAGLAGIFLHGLWPAAAAWLLKLAASGLVPVLAAIRYLAGLEHAAVTLVTPTLIEIGLYYLALWSLVEIRRIRWASPLLAMVALVAALDSGYWVYQRYFRRDLRLTVVDVGQAACALAELPGGYTILIDGGGFSDNRIFDVGQKVVAPFLWSRKIATIDLVILSHANSDHLNGLLYILEKFSPARVWSNHQPAPTECYRRFCKLIESRRIPWPPPEILPRRTTINKATLHILHPRPADLETSQDLNANSLVVRIQLGKIAFLLPGDITAGAERRILKRCGRRQLASTVLVAAHHGSRSSNSRSFLKAIAPRWVAISCGYHNRFGFPHPQVLARLDKLGCRVLRTDRCGAISFVTDGTELKVTTFLDENSCLPETP